MECSGKDCVFDVEPKNDEKFPEISIVQRNPPRLLSMIKISAHLKLCNERTDNREKKFASEKKVLCLDDPAYSIQYLSFFGQYLYSIGKIRDSIRFLEAAKSKCAKDDVPQEISQLLNEAYEKMGHFVDTELNVLCWEMDLFETNDSRSVSCEVIDGKLVAKRYFKKGDVIFVDKPIVGYAKPSRFQCNYCALKTLYAIPCSKFCEVHYCSVECQGKDKHYHKYECRGFRLQYNPVVENVLALRMLVKALDILKQNLSLRQRSHKKRVTPQMLWEVLCEDHPHSADFRQIFQSCTCDHFLEQKELYHSVLHTLTQLMYYIMNDNLLLQDYEICWKGMNGIKRDLFMESVLLRLLFLTKSQVCRFNYDLDFHKTEFEAMLQAIGTDICGEKHVFVLGMAQYCGMYRFQMEMKPSPKNYNSVFVLLDHGAVAFRAVDVIKKGEEITFIERSQPSFTLDVNLPKDNDFSVLPSFSGIHTGCISLSEQIENWLRVLTNNARIFTEMHLIDLVQLFDRFIREHKVVSKKPDRMAKLFELTTKLDKIYNEARMIPLVLMQDDWMIRLMWRFSSFRVIKNENTKNFANYIHDLYFLD